jgi:hypothetical protein
MLTFKQFMAESFRTGAKLGLYAPIDDALGQYPPLYGTPRASDLITYIDIAYKGGEPTGKNGIIRYHDKDPRVSNTHVKKRRK